MSSPKPSQGQESEGRAWPLPELLAPAGDWECVRAAVENGADAVYFGLERFNARMRAQNFTEADLPELMAFLHRRGVKGYVTVNTLVFADELAAAEEYLRTIIAAGTDAAVVQDVGICRLLRRLSPDFPIHASTQMTITSLAGVDFARELGCDLVVLARECSIREIESIQAGLAAQAGPDRPEHRALPLEVFVHGALCVAYSGQCLTSEALGGRSANRGECAQACRMPYDLIADGRPVPLGDRRYLLSPQDLAGLGLLPELMRAGIASLKIEGRLKSPEYVANITRAYRQALDRLSAAAGEEGPSPSQERLSGLAQRMREELRYDLEMAFSRGLSTGWFRGVNNQELVHARFGKKRGVFLGQVRRIEGRKVVVQLRADVKPGDGVVFDAGQPEQDEEGGRVYTVERRGEESFLGFGREDVAWRRIKAGARLWKTSDPELDRELRRSFTGAQPRFARPIALEAFGRLGEPITVAARDELGHVARASSASPLARAGTQPLDQARLRAQLGRLGGTGFRLGTFRNHLPEGLNLPVSELNRVRRELVAQLQEQRARPRRWRLHEARGLWQIRAGASGTGRRAPGGAGLVVLVRSLSQLQAALSCGQALVYCELEDAKRYREAVQLYRAAEGVGGPRKGIFVAPPRISKPGEEWILEQVRSSQADGYLVRNYDDLAFFRGDRCVGDFSLNVANALAAEYFVERCRLERVAASYDLNILQLEALLRSAPADWFEVTIHQHMPMFHMEHCLFCAFLSKGKDYRDCGRPCDRHGLSLRDRVGAEHVVKADAGCRNTVFNSRAQTGAEYADRLQSLGVPFFRIEFVQETAAEVAETVGKYRQLLSGSLRGADLWRQLRLQHRLGVTRGPMEQLG